jgi:glutathione synthase/RimK-type ligase-like ATP-grasp enzyme
MYLILALDEDIHADAVLYYLKAKNAKVRRFDPAFLFDEYGSIEQHARRDRITVEMGCTSGRLIFPDGAIVSSNEIEGIFCRSFYFPKAKDSSTTADLLATAEIRSTIRGFFSLVPKECRWINNPFIEDKVDNKVYQHQCAYRHGLAVPDTLITNSAQKVRGFFKKHHGDIIIKQLSDITLIDESPYINQQGYKDTLFKGFYTSCVLEQDLDSLEDYLGPGNAPVLLQENLNKKSELRVTLVGEKIFCYRIYSQENTKSKIDFRHVDNLKVEPCTLSPLIADKLTALLKFWNIVFAAIDLVETKDGNTVFLEANVVGNWLWLEKNMHGSQIAEAIALKLLTP